jgi:hypothetical protein
MKVGLMKSREGKKEKEMNDKIFSFEMKAADATKTMSLQPQESCVRLVGIERT